MTVSISKLLHSWLYRVAPKNGRVDTVDFQDFDLINSYLFTLLDKASFPHYNNTKIIKFGWELFILWVISYGLSFSGFARFPEFRGTINDSISSSVGASIQPATKKSQCQWRAWIVNPCYNLYTDHWTQYSLNIWTAEVKTWWKSVKK